MTTVAGCERDEEFDWLQQQLKTFRSLAQNPFFENSKARDSVLFG